MTAGGSIDPPLAPLEGLFARLLGSIGNLTLELDPLSRARLGALEGQTARFEIVLPGGGEPRPLTLTIRNRKLHWEAAAGGRPNVIIRGTLPAITAMLTDPEQVSDVQIDGDQALLGELAALLKNFEPDLAGPMGELIGPELADNLVGLAEAGIAALKSAAEAVTRSARETASSSYLDQRQFASQLDDLDALRLRVDRLAARVANVESERSGE